MPKKFLILGGAGYLGARLTETLLRHGDVTVTCRKLSADKAAWAKAHGPKLKIRPFDSTSHEVPSWGNFDCVVNLASPSASEAGKDPVAAKAAALGSVEAGLKLLVEGKTGKFVQVSSFHVYGFHGQIRYQETDAPKPTHAYGQTHLACEERLKPHLDRVTVVRPTNIVGAPAHAELGPQAGLLFLDCCRQAAQTGEIRLNNDGNAQRDFVAFPDALAGLEKLIAGDASPGIFNLAQGHSQTLKEFTEKIRVAATNALGTDVRLVFGTARDPFDKSFEVSIGKLRAKGWRPKGDLAGEMEAALTFFKPLSAPKRSRA